MFFKVTFCYFFLTEPFLRSLMLINAFCMLIVQSYITKYIYHTRIATLGDFIFA